MLRISAAAFSLYLMAISAGAKASEAPLPNNAWGSPTNWYCNDGYRKTENQCVAIDVPENAWAYADSWYCNAGFVRSDNKCLPSNHAPTLSELLASAPLTPTQTITSQLNSTTGITVLNSPALEPSTIQRSVNPPFVGTTCAENGSCYGDISASTGRPKTVTVRGYYRADGTYVRGHYRSRPR